MKKKMTLVWLLAGLSLSLGHHALALETTVGSIPGSFDVSLSGSSSYAIPLKIAPGTAGTQPQIQLNYDSQNLSGALGAGWAIGGLSAITRGPKDKFTDGAPAGIAFDNEDALYLDGQRLIKLQTPPSWGVPGATYYRKANDDYTEIVRYGGDLDASYFRVRTKGGVTIIFGNPGNASSPNRDLIKYDATILTHREIENKDRVLAFAQSSVIDTVGNYIEFHYEQNGNGDYNVKEIIYTGHGSIDALGIITPDRKPYASLTFVYDDASTPLETFVSGALLRRDKKLTDIYSCTSDKEFDYPFDCKAKLSGGDPRPHQSSHYQIKYNDTGTANRFVINTIHMFGSDDNTEISPTSFTYTLPSPGWSSTPNFLPDGLVFADTEHVAKGYRFAKVDPASGGGLDLLFAAQINGKNIAFAFKNNGPAAWTGGAQTPWSDDGKTDPITGVPTGFAPPVSFVDEDGSDLGVIIADIDGSGRASILQSYATGNVQAPASAYIPGSKSYEAHPEYKLPFLVSRDGKIVANYRLADWSGSGRQDLIYEADGKKGFLKNLGPGSGNGWQELDPSLFAPPISVGPSTHLIDLGCSGGPPALVGSEKGADGSMSWKVFRFDAAKGWQAENDPKWAPPFPADTDPEAIREVRFDGPASQCKGLIIASAKAGLHLAIVPKGSTVGGSNWIAVPSKTPPFDLIDANGRPSHAVVANLAADGYDGIVANTITADNVTLSFAYTQDSSGWHDASAQFVPSAALASDDPLKPVFAFVGPIAGQGGDDVAILNDQRVTSGDTLGRNRQFGKFYTNDGTGFVLQTSFAPPIQFATGDKDKADTGVRFIDLHGTGLPDAIVSRLVTRSGKTYLLSAAYRNTGHGWAPDPGVCVPDNFADIKPFDTSDPNPPLKDGLCPPIPFAGNDITGNPVQFVDLDGNGFVDMIYSYRDKSGGVVTKIYFNVQDDADPLKRKWIDADSDKPRFSKYLPPQDIYPLASFGIGDMGVRFTKFNVDRIGVLKGFRAGAPNQCGQIGGSGGVPPIVICTPVLGPVTSKAYSFDGNNWLAQPNYIPPLPFVTQFNSPSGPSIDLFVQILDVNASGLPSLVANYTDPVTGAVNNKVWTNSNGTWALSDISVPYPLDATYSQPKVLVQIVDVNGDGLPDIVMTDGNSPGNSKTWLGNGHGWEPNPSPNWQVPAAAITDKDGEPGFRLVDTKGDGYLDVLWMRPNKSDGTPDRGLALNTGHDWTNRRDDLVPKDISFADGEGIDQGVRLLSVTGKGLTDLIASFAGTQKVYLNLGRRSDVISSVTDGYGIKTSVAYETLLEYDCSDLSPDKNCVNSPSGVQRNPLGWRAYEREAPAAYPIVSPVPTTYVVRQAVVDEGDGKAPVVMDYRYGRYQVDAEATRSLGFGWRESLNEFSGILSRSEMVQDARARPGVAVETSCATDTGVLNTKVATAIAARDPSNNFPANLCPANGPAAQEWGTKISETNSCWTVVEGDLQGNTREIKLPNMCADPSTPTGSALSFPIIRQSALSRSVSTSYELDGHVLSRNTDTFTYDAGGGILERHGNVLSTKSVLDDGSSIETTNEYIDDPARWFLGRLTKTHVTKIGDVIAEGPNRKTERRCSRFEYDKATGLLSLQEVNCKSEKAVTTRFIRDAYGNVVSRSLSTFGEPTQETHAEFDPFGRFEIGSIDAIGYRSTAKYDVTSGQPLSAIDVNGLKTTFGYDTFGRLRRQTGPTGIDTVTDLLDATALPALDGTRNFGAGLSSPIKYAVKSQIGTLPPTWALFDAKGRQIRQVTDGFTVDSSEHRYIFKEAEYDSLGRVLRTSVPHEVADANIHWMSSKYDVLGRVCASTAINGLRTETLFTGSDSGGGTVTVVVDPKRQLSGPPPLGGSQPSLACGQAFPSTLYHTNGLDQRSSSTINMRKQMIESADAVGRVTFEYDAGGRLQKMVGPTGATTVNTYDDLGNKIAISDPDLGLWRYEYDPFQRVVRQIDAKGQITTMEYDVAGRPKRRVAQDASTIWEYDTAKHGLGKIAAVVNSNGYREDYYYDTFGRNSATAVQIDQEQFYTTSDFDAYGRATRLSYPNGFAVSNSYDAKGFFVRVADAATSKTYWNAKAIDVLGRITEEAFGNGVTTVKRYDRSDERIRSITAQDGDGEKVVGLTLDYDLLGNLKEREETVERKKEKFEYDTLNRLVALISVDAGRSEFKYDAAGRFTFKADIGDYHYAKHPGEINGSNFKPFHGVTSTNYGRHAGVYKYDLNGNMVSTPQGHFDYTADNRLKLIYFDEAKWSRFDYGPSGDRFRQFSRVNAQSEETLYVGLYERVIEYSLSLNSDFLRPAKFGGFDRLTRSRNYIANGSGVFAVVETDDTYSNTELFNPLGNQNSRWYGKYSNAETWYMHADQLGSIIRVTDQKGRIRERFWYDPWGKRRVEEDDRPGLGKAQQLGDSWKRGFSGHEHLDQFSLIHMNGRVYSVSLGMFTSVDPVNQALADTQSGNGYIYARGNPLRYVDPSGFSWLSDFVSNPGKAIGNFFGGIGRSASDFWNGVSHFASEVGKWWSENWRTVVVVVVVIVVIIATDGAASGLAGAILEGAAAGAAART